MIDIYVTKITDNISKDKVLEMCSVVSDSKRKRIKSFNSINSIQRTLIGEILIRKVICEKMGVVNKEIVFEFNKYGKPFIKNNPFYFNISHSGQYIVCAIYRYPVGVDVQEKSCTDISIARRFFSKNEIQYILSHPQEEQSNIFNLIWTRKEAYVKCLGKGLSISLGSFDVLDINLSKKILSQSLNNASLSVCTMTQYKTINNIIVSEKNIMDMVEDLQRH